MCLVYIWKVHAEYYGMQEVFDDLYAQSKKGRCFTDLMGIILSRENILLAYECKGDNMYLDRMIKSMVSHVLLIASHKTYLMLFHFSRQVS